FGSDTPHVRGLQRRPTWKCDLGVAGSSDVMASGEMVARGTEHDHHDVVVLGDRHECVVELGEQSPVLRVTHLRAVESDLRDRVAPLEQHEILWVLSGRHLTPHECLAPPCRLPLVRTPYVPSKIVARGKRSIQSRYNSAIAWP